MWTLLYDIVFPETRSLSHYSNSASGMDDLLIKAHHGGEEGGGETQACNYRMALHLMKQHSLSTSCSSVVI